jgi:hypothetical protein
VVPVITPKHFDEGVFKRLGGELVEVVREDRKLRCYAVRLKGVDGPPDFGGAIPIIHRFPQEVVADYLLPCFCLVPGVPESDDARMTGEMPSERRPADGAVARTVTRRDGTVETGYDRYETVPPAWPFSFPYEIEAHATLRGEERPMFLHLLRTFPKNRGWIAAADSSGEVRTYSAFLEGTGDLSEIQDILNRKPGKSVSVRVEGEISLFDASDDTSAFAGVTTSLSLL